MFQEDEKDEKDKEETKEKEEEEGDGGKVFPIFRRSSARTGLRGSPAKGGSTPNKVLVDPWIMLFTTLNQALNQI